MRDETLPIKYVSQEDILREAGVDPGVPQAGNIALRIANDPLIQSIASRLAAEAFIEDAIGELTPEQKERLVNRAARGAHTPVPKPAQTQPRVIWGIGYGEKTGQLFLSAEYPRGNGLVDKIYFTGRPEKLAKFRTGPNAWEPFKCHNEPVPQEYIDEYTRLYPKSINAQDLGEQMGTYYRNFHQPTPDYSLCPGPDYADNKAMAKSARK